MFISRCTGRLLLLLLCLGCHPVIQADTAPPQKAVWLMDIKGAIGPATTDYVVRGLTKAADNSARLVVLQMDTPGGLDRAMRDMIRAIIASPVPVATYVSPGGARAASAGTYILYASHIAAMSPATNLGAATPVQIGSLGGFPELPKPTDDGDTKDKQKKPVTPPATAMQKKILNDAVAYIEGLADLHGRNKDWAVKAVREAASLSATEAESKNVIDLVADNLDELLQKINGREVQLNTGKVTLSIKDAQIFHHQPDWRSAFLAVITDPNVAYILMLVGIYGLIFEFSQPGMGAPGILGGICLFLAMYAFQILPISYVGLGLILLGVGLIIAEALAPSFGILGLGGVSAFIFGSIILMDSDLPGYQIALPIILAFAAFTAGVLLLIFNMLLRSRRRQLVSGVGILIGQTGVIEQITDNHPWIRLQGELWQVRCQSPLALGEKARVTGVDGLIIEAERDTP